jgi:hypothetical protein
MNFHDTLGIANGYSTTVGPDLSARGKPTTYPDPDECVKTHNRALHTLPSAPQLTGCRDNRYNLQES